MERIIRSESHGKNSSGHDFPTLRGWLFLFLASLMLFACAAPQVQKSPAKGVYHIVKKGETAYSIARAYSISLQEMAEVNNINDVASIKEGQVIFIPDADQVIDDVMAAARKSETETKKDDGFKDQKPPEPAKTDQPAKVAPTVEKTPPEKPVIPEATVATPGVTPLSVPSERAKDKVEAKQPVAEKKEEIKREKGRFAWPVKGTVKTRFGIQPNKTYHNWIKIICPAGTTVRAADGGTVIFSANLKDFGETIIIRHAGDYATVYTHLQKRYVKADQSIRKGEKVARAGELDEAQDAYINFEIRLKGKARNPLFYLP